MTEERYNQNQTQFITEEPLLEKPRVELPPQPVVPAVPVKRPPQWVWWAVGGVIALLVIIIVVALLTPKPSSTIEKTEQTQPVTRPLTPLEQRLEVARALLKEANPTTQALPFPPIDMLLRIDKLR